MPFGDWLEDDLSVLSAAVESWVPAIPGWKGMIPIGAWDADAYFGHDADTTTELMVYVLQAPGQSQGSTQAAAPITSPTLGGEPERLWAIKLHHLVQTPPFAASFPPILQHLETALSAGWQILPNTLAFLDEPPLGEGFSMRTVEFQVAHDPRGQ